MPPKQHYADERVKLSDNSTVSVSQSTDPKGSMTLEELREYANTLGLKNNALKSSLTPSNMVTCGRSWSVSRYDWICLKKGKHIASWWYKCLPRPRGSCCYFVKQACNLLTWQCTARRKGKMVDDIHLFFILCNIQCGIPAKLLCSECCLPVS